jgi:hypothetical protein
MGFLDSFGKNAIHDMEEKNAVTKSKEKAVPTDVPTVKKSPTHFRNISKKLTNLWESGSSNPFVDPVEERRK